MSLPNAIDPNGLDMSAPPMRAVSIKTQFGPNVIHENLDFTVNHGEIVGLVGGSGTGKSVLLNTMLGLKEPEGGYVEYFGQNRNCLLYTSPSPRDRTRSRMPSSA